jgi:hypothetical protein
MKTMRSSLQALSILPVIATLAAGCVAGAGSESDEITGTDRNPFGSSNHVMPTNKEGDAPLQSAAAASAKLTYYGGPVISNVKIVSVFWNSSVTQQSTITGFYGAVTNSAYFDWLSEYNTPTQTIGRGTLAQTVTDSGAPTGNITDAQIQTEINRLITNGTVIAPDANTLYMMHFPPGTNITASDGSKSCVQFCAYHGTYTRNGKYVYYGVIPDLGGACATGCGTSTQANNTTSVASHEMIEAVTDPAVGVATNLASPLGWYDNTNGEIGDICNAQQGTIAGYTVQKEWSNTSKACIVSKTVAPPPANDFTISASPTSKTIADGSASTVTVTTALSAGTAGSVSLAVSGLPSGVTGSFSPASVTAGASSTLTLTASATAAAGSYAVSVTGTEGTAVHSASVALTITGTGGGGSTCSHAICTTGTKLVSTCDPCVTKVCAADSYCCSTKWDAMCKAEVTSICGQTCP